MRRWLLIKRLLGVLIVAPLLFACSATPPVGSPVEDWAVDDTPADSQLEALPPLRLFLVDTYSAKATWAGQTSSTQIRAGILDTLRQEGYEIDRATTTPLEYEEFFMDLGTKRTFGEMEAVTQDVIREIQAFGPDVVVVLNDEAARLLIPDYPDRNQPFVFCGLNGDVETYDLNLPNVTGVLERPKPIQTVRMAKSFVPEAEKLIVLGDASFEGVATASEVYREILNDKSLGVSARLRTTGYWETWQRIVLEDAKEADFILLLQLTGLRDEKGMLVPEPFALRWTLQNSPIPVFASWLDAVNSGAVGGLVLSNYDQGTAAANIVLRILNGAHPSSILAAPPGQNTLIMNLAAANHWELQVPLEFLTAAQIYQGHAPSRR